MIHDAGSADPDELIDAAEVARILGLAHRNSVSTYRSRYADFPAGRPSPGGGRTLLWSRGDILAWHHQFLSRRQGGSDGNPRLEELVQATSRLMLRSGSADVSIRQIAAEAGVAHSDLYRYATSKDHLRRLAIDRISDEYGAAMPKTYEEIHAQAETLIRRVVELRPALQVMASELMSPEGLAPRGQIPIEIVAQAIGDHRQETGKQSDIDPRTLGMCVAALIWGVTLFGERWLGPLGLDEVPLEQVSAAVRDLLEA